MKTKVLFVITKAGWGGAGKYVFDLATGLSKEQFEAVVALGGSGQLKDRLEEQGIRVVPLSFLVRDVAMFESRRALINPVNIISSITKEVQVLLKLRSLIKKEAPDVVHVNSSKAGGLGAFAARLAGTRRIIFTGHGWAFNEKRPRIVRVLFYFLHWLTIMLSHTTIANSNATKRDIAFLPFMKTKITVIKLSITPKPLLTREEAREKLGIPHNVFCIGTGTELHTNKGIDIVLRALASIYGVTLAIIGTGDERESLHELARDLDISDRVSFLGVVPNARDYMNAFDIFVLASRTESFGYSLLEAGLAACPVIAARVGGIPEIIDDKETGLLVPQENPKVLALELQNLIEDENQRKELGTTLKEKVLTRFSFDRMLQETIALYTR